MRLSYRLTLFGLLVLTLLLSTACQAEPPATGIVTWVDDGDSFVLKGGQKVRLLGIDAPERKGSDRDRYYLRQGIRRKTLRQIAQKALHYNIGQLKKKEVRLEYDREIRDKYGRLLAYVYLPDGRMLNRILLEKGYVAVFRRFDFKRKQEFLAIEKKARKEKRGLWKTAN